MKKLFILLSLFLLVSCKYKREDFYMLRYEDKEIVVGYDTIEKIEDDEDIDDYKYYLNEDDEKIINGIVIYVEDLDNPNIYIDDYLLDKGIKETCDDLEGEFIKKNGHACLISKNVYKRANYILIYGDILDDDIDKINRIEIYYDNK